MEASPPIYNTDRIQKPLVGKNLIPSMKGKTPAYHNLTTYNALAVENPLGFMVHVVVKSFHHRSYSGNGESSSKHRIITHLNLVIRKFLDMKQYPDSEWSLLRSLIRLECHSPDQHVVIQQLQE